MSNFTTPDTRTFDAQQIVVGLASSRVMEGDQESSRLAHDLRGRRHLLENRADRVRELVEVAEAAFDLLYGEMRVVIRLEERVW